MNWKIGDKVRLTGRSWPSYETKVQRGTYHTVSEVNGKGPLVEFKANPGVKWLLCKGWEIELVEREEETMSVDFSDVNVGDKVRLTRENGDETTFTVDGIIYRDGWITSKVNSFWAKDWDTLEIVERAFKPVPGLYSNPRTGDRAVVQRNLEAYYAAAGGRWVQANGYSGNANPAVREQNGWKREITF